MIEEKRQEKTKLYITYMYRGGIGMKRKHCGLSVNLTKWGM